MGADGQSGDAVDSSGAVTVHIRCSNGTKFSAPSALNVTVEAFKAVVGGNCEVPAEEQRLIYKGRILTDDQTLASYGAPNNAGLDMLMNMFGGLGAGGLGVPSNPNVPPEELYATQLAQLQEMGFFDTQENIRALSATAGNVHAAVERLLGNLGQ